MLLSAPNFPSAKIEPNLSYSRSCPWNRPSADLVQNLRHLSRELRALGWISSSWPIAPTNSITLFLMLLAWLMLSPCLLELAGSFTTRCRELQPPPDLVGAMGIVISTTWVVFVTAVVWLDKGWPDSYWADPNSSQIAGITNVTPKPYSLILKGGEITWF